MLARDELLALGMGRGALEHRLAVGRLHLLHRGVYAVGHPNVSLRGRWRAAVLAAGPGAALSHRSAAALRGVRDWRGGAIEVTVDARRRVDGVRVYRRVLPEDEIELIEGIPVTGLHRTLLDLAEVLPQRAVEAAINEAEYLRLTDPLPLIGVVNRYARKRGAGTVRAVVERATIGKYRTRSELEQRFLPFIDRHGLPRPSSNAKAESYECDAVWPAQRVVLELDSRQAHLTTSRFESDRVRDRRLQAAGWRVVRLTWRQLHDDPSAVARDLRTLLLG